MPVLGTVALLLTVALVLVLRGAGAQASDRASGVPSVTVGRALDVRPVADGFLGMSLEYYGITWYGGTDAQAPDPVFVQLLRNLAPGGSLSLRIGGDSADWLWLSTPGVMKGPALKVTITARTIAVLATLTRELDARLIIDINLEDDNLRLADNIARTIVTAAGADHVAALEIGNEPDLYTALAWYTNRAGLRVFGRPAPYTVADYTREFNRYSASLGDAALAGPATSGPWNSLLAPFVAGARHLRILTMHDYPLKLCGTSPGEPTYPTIAKLLSPASTLGLAQNLAPELALAHHAGKQLRVDEINSVACFGLTGVSNTYASALWALETSLQFARLGYDGLDFSSVPSTQYRLFLTSHQTGAWTAQVEPDYYGLLAFADAVPPGSRFLSTPDSGANPQVFAVATPSHQIRVIAVNTGAARTLSLRIPGAHGTATVSYLRGPSLSATGGVSLAGQSFGATTRTGELAGRPSASAVRPVDGAAVVSLPAHSAAILSVDG